MVEGVTVLLSCSKHKRSYLMIVIHAVYSKDLSHCPYTHTHAHTPSLTANKKNQIMTLARRKSSFARLPYTLPPLVRLQRRNTRPKPLQKIYIHTVKEEPFAEMVPFKITALQRCRRGGAWCEVSVGSLTSCMFSCLHFKEAL